MKRVAPFGLLLCLLSSACTQIPPQVTESEPAITTLLQEQDPVEIPDLPKVFDTQKNTVLQGYIDQVIANNKTLKSLTATVQAFELGSKVVAAQASPTVDLGVTGQRNKSSTELKPENNVNLALNAKWAVDLWGRLADETQAAQLQTQKQELEYQNARRVLVAQAAQSWSALWRIEQQEQIMRERTANAENLVKIVAEYYQNGQQEYDDLIRQRTATARLQEAFADIRSEKQIQQHRLNILRGEAPRTPLAVLKIPMQPVIVSLPETIPAVSLLDRPDIQAAFKQIEILDAEIRAAHKAMLPQINLTASLSKSSTSLGSALGSDLLWQLVGGLTQPLFNGSQLRNQARQKSKQAESSYYHYEQTVLNAMEEVENNLAIEQQLSEQLDLTKSRMAEIEKSFNAREESYQAGLINIQQYLEARDEFLAVQNDWIATQESHLRNRISLALAIGQSL